MGWIGIVRIHLDRPDIGVAVDELEVGRRRRYRLHRNHVETGLVHSIDNGLDSCRALWMSRPGVVVEGRLVGGKGDTHDQQYGSARRSRVEVAPTSAVLLIATEAPERRGTLWRTSDTWA